MKKAIVLTAFDRPGYFEQAIESWAKVRDVDEWDFYVSFEPHDTTDSQDALYRSVFHKHPRAFTSRNGSVQGVLHHPWVAFDRLFNDEYDFVIRAEDDLVVSADILEYFDWAKVEFKNDPQVATVNAYTQRDGLPDEVALVPIFSPLVWGTWKDRWDGLIGPTWDHDYSTYNGYPGNQAGWDWNLNTRIFPQHDLRAVFPLASRVHNVGLVGTHSLPENYETSASFRPDHGPQRYRVVDV